MNELLFSEFPEISKDDWKNTIIKDLKGQPYEKIQWQTHDGILIEPFYRKEDLPKSLPNLQKSERGWWITDQILIATSIEDANKQAKLSLANGADAILFTAHAEGGKSFGVPIQNPKEVASLLAGIDLSKTPVILSLANRTPEFATAINEASATAKLVLGDYDPYGTAILCGELGATEQDVITHLKNLCSKTKNTKHTAIHSYYLRDAGASISQELSFALSWGVEYLNILVDSGVSPEMAANSIWFWMGVGSDYFTEIAKFRAFRILWAQILNAYKPGLGDSHQPIIQAMTTEWNFTAYDPHVNILRGTTAAMSAVIGGSDFVIVSPFDRFYTNQSEFGVRIARNSQLLLRHEAHLDKVEDPANGSYYLELLTIELARTAWSSFQSTEKDGGFHKALKSGTIQSTIESSARKLRDEVSSKKQTLLGTNQYPLTTERHPELKENIDKTKTILDFPNNHTYKRIDPVRLSYDFDRLRLKTDLHVASGKPVPKVFLLTIGDLTMRKARAGFASNFIGCLGYEIKDSNGFASIKEGIAAAKQANANIVVLCSSDEEYANLIPEFGDAIKTELPNAWAIVAGYPKDLISLAESKGIGDFIHLKRNLIEFMEKAQNRQ